MKSKYLKLTAAVIATSLLVACGGGDNGDANTGESDNAATESTTTEETVAPEDLPVAEFTIEANDAMQYNLDKIEVKAGQTVRVTLKNVGSMPVEQMGHNWTLLKSGVEPATYGGAAMQHKDEGYQVPGTDDVIVNTSMLGPGQEETVEFTAPSTGIYKYICTFPGHYGVMKGTFLVR